jgi:hypothetical protein
MSECRYCLEEPDILFRRSDDPDKDRWYCRNCEYIVSKIMYNIREDILKSKTAIVKVNRNV